MHRKGARRRFAFRIHVAATLLHGHVAYLQSTFQLNGFGFFTVRAEINIFLVGNPRWRIILDPVPGSVVPLSITTLVIPHQIRSRIFVVQHIILPHQEGGIKSLASLIHIRNPSQGGLAVLHIKKFE